jgi:hypothetical protein
VVEEMIAEAGEEDNFKIFNLQKCYNLKEVNIESNRKAAYVK